MNERQAMEYLDEVSRRRGISPGLESIRELCRRLGDPQKDLKFIHIAGTNGKGSVSAYIASVLKCAGYRVGRYISPAVFQYREKIRAGAMCITKQALCRGLDRIRASCDEMVAEGLAHPTVFEIETALGFLWFREKACDLVVLETGMGGMLDATNIVENTFAAVITSVSMDHMQFLGNTLGEIAVQKAGIIKRNCSVASIRQKEEAMTVIAARAEEMGCVLTVTDPDKISHIRYGLEKQSFDYGQYKKLEIRLAGKFQIENAALAVDVIRILEDRGFAVTEAQLRRGLSEAVWPGRFEVMDKKPYFVADGAHNEDAAKRLKESIEFYFTNKRIIYIMGVLRDKEYDRIIAITHSLADQIITVTPPGNPRALPAYDLARAAAGYHENVTAADSLEEAVEMSRLLAGKDGVIIAFGSLSYLGKLAEIVRGKTGGTDIRRKGTAGSGSGSGIRRKGAAGSGTGSGRKGGRSG